MVDTSDPELAEASQRVRRKPTATPSPRPDDARKILIRKKGRSRRPRRGQIPARRRPSLSRNTGTSDVHGKFVFICSIPISTDEDRFDHVKLVKRVLGLTRLVFGLKEVEKGTDGW